MALWDTSWRASAALQQGEQVGTGVALAAVSFFEVTAELLFHDAVHALDLLLFTQLQTVVGSARTRSAAMLTGLGVELALVCNGAACALEEQVGAFTAGEFGLGAEVTCHLSVLCYQLPQTIAGAAWVA
jgi:hypothetical protein